MKKVPVIAAADVRRLLMSGCGLLDDPSRACTGKSLYKAIEQLGFVQLDTISVVERAHNHILWTRFHGFRPEQLDALQHKGMLFEHFTHDASLIPSVWYPHWRHRFARVQWKKWIDSRMADRKDDLLGSVRGRIEKEGPLLARDFEDTEHQRGAWWDWKPAKAALEYLWRTGELTIPRREKFQKVYDLTHRVMPEAHGAPMPSVEEHVEWACGTAIERLGVATNSELMQFWRAIKPAQVTAWTKEQVASGRLVEVLVSDEKGGTKKAVAVKNHGSRIQRLHRMEVGSDVRLLSPFDPLVRNRDRLERLFGFEYRFEAFVPAPKRKHGYYVLPILRGDRLIGRLDPQLDRKSGTLTIRGLWFEGGATADDKRAVEAGIERYAAFCGAKEIKMPRKSKTSRD